MAPIDFFDRILNYYRKDDSKSINQPPSSSLQPILVRPFDRLTADPEKNVQVITPETAAILSIAYTVVYVLPFYLSSKTRPSPQLPRDAPSVIRARIRAVVFSCILNTFVTLYITLDKGGMTRSEVLQILGWWPMSSSDVLRPLALVMLLFSGPMFEKLVVDGLWRDLLTGRAVVEHLSSWIGVRNYIAGPITEEWTFRSLLLPLHLLARLSPLKLVFLTPLYFGLAHIHHFYEFTLTHSHMPLLPRVSRSLLQFAYTSLFGFFAAFLFLRTSSVAACIVAHAFCNVMGLPRMWGRVGADGVGDATAGTGGVRTNSQGRRKARDSNAGVMVQPKGVGMLWSVVYYLLLVVGVVGFYCGLFPMTESKHALVNFGKKEK